MFIHKKPLPELELEIYFTHHVLQASTSYFSYVLRLDIILLLLPTCPEFDVQPEVPVNFFGPCSECLTSLRNVPGCYTVFGHVWTKVPAHRLQ